MSKVLDTRIIDGYKIRRRSDGSKTIELPLEDVERYMNHVVHINKGHVDFVHKDLWAHDHEWTFDGEFLVERYSCECGSTKFC